MDFFQYPDGKVLFTTVFFAGIISCDPSIVRFALLFVKTVVKKNRLSVKGGGILFDILLWYVIITIVNFPSNNNGAENIYEAIY